MRSGNFRVLIFIDLLATALGGSLILMMVLSTTKTQSAPPAGVARNFIFYQVYAEDPNAYLKIIVQNSDKKQWMESTMQELADSTSGTFLLNNEKQDVFIWGPVTEFDTSGNMTTRNSIPLKNIFNVYSTTEEKGVWTLGALYYNNKTLNEGSIDAVNKPIKLHHYLKTLNGTILNDTTTFVTLGNYGYITYDSQKENK